MDQDVFAAVCAGAICLGIWGALAGIAGAVAQWRTSRVERELGRPALPADEWPLLWYAGACVLWLSALVLALIGLSKREWTRAGRNSLFIFLAHITGVVFAALFSAALGDDGAALPVPLIAVSCAIAGIGISAAAALGWVYAGARADRIEKDPPTGKPPGAERFAIYAASLVLWPVGLVAAAAYSKPENVRVGATALRLSLLQVAAIAAAVCISLPIALSYTG
jgi:hypothetical protein